MSTELLTAVLGGGGFCSIITLILQKLFSRKQDKQTLEEKENELHERIRMRERAMADKYFETLEKRLNYFIAMSERSAKDVAVLQANIAKIYPYTCCVLNCDKRTLLDNEAFSFNLTMNDNPEQDT